MKEYFTVNIIGDGILQNQYLTDDYSEARRTCFQYYKEYKEEYVEDGYVKITKFKTLDSSGEDIITIWFNEEIDESDLCF